MEKNLKLVIGVLASIVPLITYIISTIITHVELNKLLSDYDQYHDWDICIWPCNDKKLKLLSFYFTSSYVTFILFICFLALMLLAAFNILKNYLLIITLTCFDGAIMVTVGAGLYTSLFASQYTGAGVGMFVGAALLLLVKIFPILPLTIELLTKGISLWNTRNEDSMLRKYLPFAIYGALIFGFIASLLYTGAALTVTEACYTQKDNDGTCFYSPSLLFQYSLPLFIFLQMIVAMVLFVQFKWKWGVHTFAFFSSFLLVTLGIALNIMAIQLYNYDDQYDDRHDDRYDDRYDDDYEENIPHFIKVLHKGNIIMTLTSVLMIVITIFVNMAWPVLYNLRNPAGNEETITSFPFLHYLRNPTGNEETNMTFSALHNPKGNEETNTTFPVLHNLRNPTGNEETNTNLPVLDNLLNPITNGDTEELLNK